MDRKQTVSLEMVLMGIKPIDEEAVKAAKAHWDCVAKPLNSLGVLEEDRPPSVHSHIVFCL